jgi:hypothetical protein
MKFSDVDAYLKQFGFMGVQYVVEPQVEKIKDAVKSIAVPRIPPAVLEYNARNAIVRQMSPLQQKREDRRGSSSGSRGLRERVESATSVSSGRNDSTGSISPAMELLGLRYGGLYGDQHTPLSPYSEQSQDTSSFRGSPSPVVQQQQSAYRILYRRRHNNFNPSIASTSKVTRLSLVNSISVDNFFPIASVKCGYHKSTEESFQGCISALGGPSVLMPLVQAAVTEKELINALFVILKTLVRSQTNLRYMQSGGYKALAFIISNKNVRIVSNRVLEMLSKFGTLTTPTNSIGGVSPTGYSTPQSIGKCILVDTIAVYQLLLNHQVWNVSCYNKASTILHLLTTMTNDYNDGKLNCVRLR